jgi:hypothetical protein
MCIKPRKTGKFYETKVLGAAGAARQSLRGAYTTVCAQRGELCFFLSARAAGSFRRC